MALQAGVKAPDFKAPDQNGDIVKLSDYKGKKVALYFYPQDDTETCTKEACNLRDNFASLKKKGVVIIGVSPDAVKSHKKFETKYSLPFTLVADEDQKILKAYDVWGEKQMFGKKYMGTHRTTFLINEKGKIEHVIEKVVSKDHAAQIIEVWGL